MTLNEAVKWAYENDVSININRWMSIETGRVALRFMFHTPIKQLGFLIANPDEIDEHLENCMRAKDGLITKDEQNGLHNRDDEAVN